MIRTVLAAAVARAALADLHALAPATREEHRPAVKRSAEMMPPPPPTGRNFCSACGAPIHGSFCSQCGARA